MVAQVLVLKMPNTRWVFGFIPALHEVSLLALSPSYCPLVPFLCKGKRHCSLEYTLLISCDLTYRMSLHEQTDRQGGTCSTGCGVWRRRRTLFSGSLSQDCPFPPYSTWTVHPVSCQVGVSGLCDRCTQVTVRPLQYKSLRHIHCCVLVETWVHQVRTSCSSPLEQLFHSPLSYIFKLFF